MNLFEHQLSIVIGVTMIGSTTVSISAVVGIFLSNVPKGLSSSGLVTVAGFLAAFVLSKLGG